MPEGPEVRRLADSLSEALVGKPIVSLTARTRSAKAWLQEHPGVLAGQTILKVRSHGKNLVGFLSGGDYFYSHLMMWGRWQVVMGEEPVEVDRRERARIVVPGATAILYSAPIFEPRHYVFRRTNLPCLNCYITIRQLRQVTRTDEEGEKSRIIYFCPTCQGTKVELKKPKRTGTQGRISRGNPRGTGVPPVVAPKQTITVVGAGLTDKIWGKQTIEINPPSSQQQSCRGGFDR